MVKLAYIESRALDPFYNLALEEYLTLNCAADTIVLYLWQNRPTVVIGRHQSAGQECNFEVMQKYGVLLARRLSGGGAVYHDAGDLNYSFIAARPNYDKLRQLQVVKDALRNLSLDIELSGRNDLLLDGRKISGTAFYEYGDRCCQHGTLLLDVDIVRMTECLKIGANKLRAHSVASVRSRVVNIQEYLPALTLDKLKQALRRAFAASYNSECQELQLPRPAKDEIRRARERFADDRWRFGDESIYTHSFEQRFAWGSIRICVDIKDGKISAAAVYSDSLQTDIIDKIKSALLGIDYNRADVRDVIKRMQINAAEEDIRQDILSWLYDSI